MLCFNLHELFGLLAPSMILYLKSLQYCIALTFHILIYCCIYLMLRN